MIRTLFFLHSLALSCITVFAQDTIYTTAITYRNVKIRDNQPDFIEYRLLDNEFSKENYFLKKKDINAIVSKGGFHEVIIHDDAEKFHCDYYWIDSLRDTIRIDKNYDPVSKFERDSAVKLCRFRNDAEYQRLYGKWNHFYLNDPEKKFCASQRLIFLGVNFSFMRLVNQREIANAAKIKYRYLSDIAKTINSTKYFFPMSFSRSVKVIESMSISENSYKVLDDISWVSDKDYRIDARKIPAIIKSLSIAMQDGIALIFIIEKFSKIDHELSGYWVAFDLTDRKTLLIDYIVAGGVGAQSTGFGWDSYWLSALTAAGAYDPYTFYKYYDLEKKGKVDLLCD